MRSISKWTPGSMMSRSPGAAASIALWIVLPLATWVGVQRRLHAISAHVLARVQAQMAQEYINFTLTGYTNRWRAKLSTTFALRKDNLSVEFDYSDLTTADMTARINNWRIAIMSMMATPNEARIDLGWLPAKDPGADALHFPQNMASAGSQSTGNAPDGAGRPEGS